MRSFAILAILFAALAAAAQTPPAFEWKGAILPNQTFEIRNVNGDIKAETAAGTDVEISVRIEGTRPDPRTVHIDVLQHEGGILACTIYDGLSWPAYCTPERTPALTLTNSDIRVIYTIRVPAGIRFVPRTINGKILADVAGSSVSAAAVNGRIVLSVDGPADAHVVNGSIVASLANVDWTGSREFGSVNGSVDVELPSFCHASVRAYNLFGSLQNDFGIPIRRGFIGGSMSGDIDGGGPGLVLGTVNGSIHLRRAPTE